MKLTDLLDQIDRLDQEATKGPWVVHPGVKYVYTTDAGMVLDRAWADQPDADLHLAALARTALPQLAKALRDIMEIHKPFYDDHYYNGMDGESLHRFVARCEGCHHAGGIEDYPCPTVQAITDALGDDDA